MGKFDLLSNTYYLKKKKICIHQEVVCISNMLDKEKMLKDILQCWIEYIYECSFR